MNAASLNYILTWKLSMKGILKGSYFAHLIHVPYWFNKKSMYNKLVLLHLMHFEPGFLRYLLCLCPIWNYPLRSI